jgi:hypothetical protein
MENGKWRVLSSEFRVIGYELIRGELRVER